MSTTLDLGYVKPGRKLWIPYDTMSQSDGGALTATALDSTDIKVYRDGGTTPAALTTALAISVDFATLTGIHLISVDLADNAGDTTFWRAGSTYTVVLNTHTVNAVATIRRTIARFHIGLPGAIINTFIASLSSQTVFTLNDGPAEADALNGCPVVIHDQASAVQMAVGTVLDYSATTKQVTLQLAPTFTIAANDNVMIMPRPAQAGALTGYPLTSINAINDDNSLTGLFAAFVDQLQSITFGATHITTPSTTTSIAVQVLNPPEVATATDQLKGKFITFTSLGSNTHTVKCVTRRIIASTTGATPTLTLDEALPGIPSSLNVFVIHDGNAIDSSGRPKVDIEAILGSSTAALQFSRMALSAASGTLTTGSTTQVLNIGAISPSLSDANQVKGRVVLIVDDSASEAALKVQGSRISASTTTTLTLETPLTRAPATGNVFIIV